MRLFSTTQYMHHFNPEKPTVRPYSMEKLLELANSSTNINTGALLVYYKDKILPVSITDIALFFRRDSVVYLTTFNEKTYHLNKTLEELEKAAGITFIRINRQYIINRKAVVDASSYSQRKMAVMLTISTEEQLLISKEKVPQFLHWLTLA